MVLTNNTLIYCRLLFKRLKLKIKLGFMTFSNSQGHTGAGPQHCMWKSKPPRFINVLILKACRFYGAVPLLHIYRKPCSRLSIFRIRELNLLDLNDLKTIVQRSSLENTVLLNRFTSRVHREQFIRNSNCLKLS